MHAGHVLAVERERLLFAVRGYQHDVVLILEKLLERGLGLHAVDDYGGDLPVLHLGLAADVHHVAVFNAEVYHAVALALEGKVAQDMLGHVDIVRDVLLGQYGRAAGDFADERLLVEADRGEVVRQRARQLNIVVYGPYKLIKIKPKRLCNSAIGVDAGRWLVTVRGDITFQDRNVRFA